MPQAGLPAIPPPLALVDSFRAGPKGFLSYSQGFEVGWNSHKEPKDRREYIAASDKKDVDDAMFHIHIEVLARFANAPVRYDLVRVRDLGWRLVRVQREIATSSR